MARIDKGNALTVPEQQPGGKVSNDGYGLLTATVVWKSDQNATYNSVVNRGSTCPIEGNCAAHRYSVVFDALGVATLTVDYVGIADGATRTDPQITGSQGLTAEHITTHPNFFELAPGFSDDPIAGVGTGDIDDPVYAVAPQVSPTEYAGNNGSRFESSIGGKFLGFKKPEFKTLYGKTNYLAPQTSISGVFYTDDSADVTDLLALVGKTSNNGSYNGISLIPTYMGSSYSTGDDLDQLLLAQISFEDFGLLYKIQYELRYNRTGYNASVYAPA